MKFGETLDATLFPLWKAYYFDYEALKGTLSLIKTSFAYADLFREHQVHIENDPTQPFRFLISKVHFSYKNANGQRVEAVMKVSTVRADRRRAKRSGVKFDLPAVPSNTSAGGATASTTTNANANSLTSAHAHSTTTDAFADSSEHNTTINNSIDNTNNNNNNSAAKIHGDDAHSISTVIGGDAGEEEEEEEEEVVDEEIIVQPRDGEASATVGQRDADGTAQGNGVVNDSTHDGALASWLKDTVLSRLPDHVSLPHVDSHDKKGIARVDGQEDTQYVFAGKMAAVVDKNKPFDERRIASSTSTVEASKASPVPVGMVMPTNTCDGGTSSTDGMASRNGLTPSAPRDFGEGGLGGGGVSVATSYSATPSTTGFNSLNSSQCFDMSREATMHTVYNELQHNALDFGANLGIADADDEFNNTLKKMMKDNDTINNIDQKKSSSKRKKRSGDSATAVGGGGGGDANAPPPSSSDGGDQAFGPMVPHRNTSALLSDSSASPSSPLSPHAPFPPRRNVSGGPIKTAAGNASKVEGLATNAVTGNSAANASFRALPVKEKSIHKKVRTYRWVITEANHLPLGPADDFNYCSQEEVGHNGRVAYYHPSAAPSALMLGGAGGGEEHHSLLHHHHIGAKDKQVGGVVDPSSKHAASAPTSPATVPAHSGSILAKHFSSHNTLHPHGSNSNNGAAPFPFDITMSFSWDGNDAGYFNAAIAHAVYEYQRAVSLAVAPKIQWELTKISTFYVKQSHILSHAALLCVDSVKMWQQMTAAEHTKLRTAYRQTYLMLQVLQQYCDLNTQAVAKFLKKLDKNTFQSTLDDYQGALVAANFKMGKDSRNIKLQAVLVDAYAKYACEGKQKSAHLFLESGGIADSGGVGHKNSLSVLLSLAFLWGLVIAVLAMIIQLLVSLQDGSPVIKVPAWDLFAKSSATQLILIPFTLIALPFLFSIDVMVWEWFGINFAFVFELDPLFHFTGAELMRDSLIYILAWELCVFSFLRVNMSNVYCPTDPLRTVDEADAAPTVTPLWCILPLFLLIYVCIAVRNYFSDQRRPSFSAQVMFNILRTPFMTVKFADFFIADQLTSITSPLYELQFYWCTFSTEKIAACVHGKGWTVPILNFLPSIWRFLQCIRRYLDEPVKKRRAFPNLVNAGKYFWSILDVLTWMLYNGAKFENASDGVYWTAFGFAFFTAVVSQMYRFVWDVVVDAGMWIRVRDAKQKKKHSGDAKKEGAANGLCDDDANGNHEDDDDDGNEAPSKDNQEPRQVLYAPSAAGSAEDESWHWELRKDRIYKYWWPYIVFFIIDFVLRWMWLVKYYAVIHYPFSFAVWSCIEIFRRFVWNLFRMENEHVSNTENYRATLLAPIPQKDISKWDIEIDEKFMANKKINVDNFTTVTRYYAMLPDRVKANILTTSAAVLGSAVQISEQTANTAASASKIKWTGLPNEGKSRIFSEFPEEVKVLLLLNACGNDTMVDFKERVEEEERRAKAEAIEMGPLPTIAMTGATPRGDDGSPNPSHQHKHRHRRTSPQQSHGGGGPRRRAMVYPSLEEEDYSSNATRREGGNASHSIGVDGSAASLTKRSPY